MFDQALQSQLPKLAVEFFVIFSRFERAMKRTGTYAAGNENEVKADWDKLANELGQGFFDEMNAAEVASTLIGKPPMKQIKSADGTLGWRDMGEVKSTAELFLAIRRARNNLMHGGKYRDGGDGQPAYVEGPSATTPYSTSRCKCCGWPTREIKPYVSTSTTEQTYAAHGCSARQVDQRSLSLLSIDGIDHNKEEW